MHEHIFWTNSFISFSFFFSNVRIIFIQNSINFFCFSSQIFQNSPIIGMKLFWKKYPTFRCFIPECEFLDTKSYEPPWLPNAVPFSNGKPSNCYRYASVSNEIQLSCPASNFNRSNIIRCNQHIYKTSEISILNEVSSFFIQEFCFNFI